MATFFQSETPGENYRVSVPRGDKNPTFPHTHTHTHALSLSLSHTHTPLRCCWRGEGSRRCNRGQPLARAPRQRDPAIATFTVCSRRFARPVPWLEGAHPFADRPPVPGPAATESHEPPSHRGMCCAGHTPSHTHTITHTHHLTHTPSQASFNGLFCARALKQQIRFKCTFDSDKR